MAKKRSTFRFVRIIILLTILLIVSGKSWQVRAKTARWDMSQWVIIYPVNTDNSDVAQNYINSLNVNKFSAVEEYLNRQAHEYGISLETPFTVQLAPQVDTLPPMPPVERTIPAAMWYSLKLRYYGLTNDSYDGPPADIKIYVKYHEPAPSKRLSHSIGLEKGKIGIVNGFASWKNTSQTNVIIAHEILHTVGGSDKYDLATHKPYYPEGFADPEQRPLLPQSRAEIMGINIVISEDEMKLPTRLGETTIGEVTAREINWLHD